MRNTYAKLQWIAENVASQKFVRDYRKLLLVLVAHDFEDAISLGRSAKTVGVRMPKVEIVVGYISPDGEFKELSAT